MKQRAVCPVHRTRCVGAAIMLIAMAGACTEERLQRTTIKLQISGTYCPSASAILGVPLRIMLIIDTSESMKTSDPQDGRMVAAQEMINSFSPEDDVRFSLVTFDDYVVPATVDSAGQGIFTRDPGILAAGLSQLTREDAMTNYLVALGGATTIIRNDLIATANEIEAAEAAGEEVDAMHPFYFIVFLSDGIPKIRGAQIQDTDSILFNVRELLDVPEPAMGAVLHTAFLGMGEDGSEELELEAKSLLMKMAEEGGGSFADFVGGQAIDFRMFEFNIVRLHDAKSFIAYNRHAVLGELGVEADTDADGLSDIEEQEHGSDPLVQDTDGDNLGDGFEVLSGQSPTQRDPYCVNKVVEDTDSDGLSDCEEKTRNYDPERFDSDLDLLPDRVELFSGTNPADGEDIRLDMDFDLRRNDREVIERTNPQMAEKGSLYKEYAYQVQQMRRESMSASGTLERVCYDATVRNVSLVNTLDGRDNEVVLEFIETPDDDPNGVFTLRRHVLSVRPEQAGLETTMHLDIGEVEFETISVQRVDLFEEEEERSR